MAARSTSHQKRKFDTRIDFTPMVDMNMLLITFFMLCTTMIKSQTLKITLPTNEKVEEQDRSKIKESEAITIIIDGVVGKDGKEKGLSELDKGKIFYYPGMPQLTFEGGHIANNPMKEVSLDDGASNALRKILAERNSTVLNKINTYKNQWRNGQISKDEYAEKAREIRNDSTIQGRPAVVIKATPNASYRDLVSVLDQMQINQISRYQIDKITQVDSAMMIQLEGNSLGK